MYLLWHTWMAVILLLSWFSLGLRNPKASIVQLSLRVLLYGYLKSKIPPVSNQGGTTLINMEKRKKCAQGASDASEIPWNARNKLIWETWMNDVSFDIRFWVSISHFTFDWSDKLLVYGSQKSENPFNTCPRIASL